jgi:hypothetical protein
LTVPFGNGLGLIKLPLPLGNGFRLEKGGRALAGKRSAKAAVSF